MAAKSDRIDAIEWERPPLVERRSDAALEAWARAEGLRCPAYFTGSPWVARACARLVRKDLRDLDWRVADLAVVVVSRDNACRNCYAASRVFLRIVGLDNTEIDRLEGGLLLADEDAALGPALDFARRVSRANPPPSSADVKALREAGYSEAELKELAYVAASYVMINRLSTFVALPPEGFERAGRTRLLALVRPFVRARVLRSYHRRCGEVRLNAEEKEGPYAEIVCAFDGLPAGRKLRAILNEAFAPTSIPQRTKALVFAVVARALGCPRSEGEAFRLLDAEGIPPAQGELILAHLGSPALQPLEAATLPFVRETVWYQPAPIQRRARELMAELDEEQFLELLGLCALANAVCRLNLVLGQLP